MPPVLISQISTALEWIKQKAWGTGRRADHEGDMRTYSHHRGHGETGRMANRGTSWAKMDSLRLGLQKNY